MSAADLFFNKSVNGATGHADCLYCPRNSAQGGGRWDAWRTSWVCDEHIAQQEKDEADERARRRAGILSQFGARGRYYIVVSADPGDSIEYGGETFEVARKHYHPGSPRSQEGEEFERGWYVKVK